MPEKSPVVYKVKANEFDFTFSQEQVESLDLLQKSSNEFHLIKDHHSFKALIISADDTAKHQKIEVQGERFNIEIKDELDQMLDKMGFSNVAAKHVKEIKAPMPGLVLEIAVDEKQSVREGDKILILVAMKMENVIIIHADATIKRIAVKPGQAVEKGQVLVELE